MIRGNWSLAAEVRKNESKQQQKVQQRQKHQHKLQKLQGVDPVRLYYQLERLQKEESLSTHDAKRLKTLQEDWEFIEKNKLHAEKVVAFKAKLEADKKQKELDSKKLWGRASVYFNPELNPLGKVPTGMSNVKLPLKRHQVQRYEKDPLLASMGVVMPEGEPPKFYKIVVNADKKEREIVGEARTSMTMAPRAVQKRKLETKDPHTASMLAPEEEEAQKRQKGHTEEEAD